MTEHELCKAFARIGVGVTLTGIVAYVGAISKTGTLIAAWLLAGGAIFLLAGAVPLFVLWLIRDD